MPRHLFRVGQTVAVHSEGAAALVPSGSHVIVRLLPPVGREPQYRVHSTSDGYDRVVMESQIEPIEERPAVVEKKPAPKPRVPKKVVRRSR